MFLLSSNIIGKQLIRHWLTYYIVCNCIGLKFFSIIISLYNLPAFLISLISACISHLILKIRIHNLCIICNVCTGDNLKTSFLSSPSILNI